MAIITISRGSFSHGKEVAECVAERLQYQCISREVLLDASERFNIAEIKLVRAIHDSPSILDRFKFGRQAYIAYIQCALTQRLRPGNVVYHGFAGHLLLPGISNVLKVRILASMEQRIAVKAAREGISAQEASAIIRKDDEERRKWTQSLYGVDPRDSTLYDLVVHLDKLTREDAVELICRAVSSAAFATTPAARQQLDNLAKACEIKALLIESAGDLAVTCDYGNCLIYAKSGAKQADRIRKALPSVRDRVEGLSNLEIRAQGPIPNHAV